MFVHGLEVILRGAFWQLGLLLHVPIVVDQEVLQFVTDGHQEAALEDQGGISIIHFFEIFPCVGDRFQTVHQVEAEFESRLSVHKEEEVGDLAGFERW